MVVENGAVIPYLILPFDFFMRWVPYPFLRLTPAFIVGIVLALSIREEVSPALLWGGFAIGILAVLVAAARYRRWRGAGLFGGIGGLVALVMAGWLHTEAQTEAGKLGHLTTVASDIQYVEGVVIRAEEERANTWRCQVQVAQVRIDSNWHPYQGKVMVYQRKDSLHHPLQYGDRVLLKGEPTLVPGPRNPQEFDYQTYLARQQIYHQVFVSGAEVRTLGYAPPSVVRAVALEAQQAFAQRLAEGIENPRERSIVSALVLGVKDGLEPETRQAYATAGAMHVLAVSGLHVGIVYAICVGLLGGLRRRPLGRWIFAIWVLICLWGFAFLTGLSPSVLRAATMFSFMVLAQTTRRKTNIYNTLAASAFLLLCFDPYLLTSVGFQLSYLAVLGIVYLQPRIYGWWSAPNRVLDWAWSLTTVSLAAQLATGPLAVYYFHVFPTYFFLSNLLVVPMATLILGGGLLVLGLSVFSLEASVFLADLLERAVWAMNEVIFALEKIPGSRIEDLMLSPTQVMLLVAALLAFFAFWERRRFHYLVTTVVLVVVGIASVVAQQKQQAHQVGVTVYHTGGQPLTSLHHGRNRALLWNGEGVLPEVEYQVKGHEQQAGFRPSTQEPLSAEVVWSSVQMGKLTHWYGKTILYLQEAIPEGMVWPSFPIDFLVVGKDVLRSLDDLPSGLQADQIILDSSNKLYIAARLQAEAESRQWNCHSVPHQGAFTANWKPWNLSTTQSRTE